MNPHLPPPALEEQRRSIALQHRIRTDIEHAGGFISFSSYMNHALYSPGLGYYSTASEQFGARGDFVTAPQISELFGQALARQVAQGLRLGGDDIFEAGAGNGLLAADLLCALQRENCLPKRYLILEVSADLRARQRKTLHDKVPTLLDRVQWLDALPERFCGVVLANEVLDAMPAQRFSIREGELFELGVGWQAQSETFCWHEKPPSAALKQAVTETGLLATAMHSPLAQPYRSELALAARAWLADWGARLERGLMLLIDYGYPRDEYYLPVRSDGTLACYYRHRAHSDPFFWPGLCDITVSQDFTALAEAAFHAGLQVSGYVPQGTFLLNCGLLDLPALQMPSDSTEYLQAARAVHRISGTQEMGEIFKVLALTQKWPASEELLGFRHGDRTHTL